MQNINLNWQFYVGDITCEQISNFELVNLPHTNKFLPLQYFNELDYQFVSSYKKVINVDKEEGKRYILNFEGIMMKATLYVNKKFVAESLLGYLDFTNDITDHLVDGDNEIIVVTDSRETVNATPFGGLIDYMTFGGIYREASFSIKNKTYIKNVKATYLDNKLTVEVFTNNFDYENIHITLNNKKYTFKKEDKCVIDDLTDIKLWDINNPNLYKIIVEIDDLDSYSFRFGFRTLEIKDSKLYLNGNMINIFGLNRHQSYPHIGYAATKNMQYLDAKILKDLGVNLVRTSHYPQSRHFLDACDELGLLVFEEIPGWQHLGDEAWKETVIDNTREMIMRDYNHPSIVIFGVRVNESPDCDQLYTKTNALAHELDKTRFTGGVRFIFNSHLLEDIYTFNDFLWQEGKPTQNPMDVTGLDYEVPHLITEFCGHTYPTKKIDNEHRQLTQMLRHLDIQNSAHKNRMMGAIGWCAFDYNTHHQFGSGDKICYHGVMDIYRLPKLATAVYKGQKSRNDEIVLEVPTIFAYGERNYGGVTPLYAFTNCDEVKLFSGKTEYNFVKCEEYDSLPNPVFVLQEMSGAWGMDWFDATVVGYIDGKEVIRKEFLANQLPVDLALRLSHNEIELNDAARIEVRMVDSVNNVLRYDNSILKIEVSNGVLLCPNEVALYGGEYAFYVRSNNTGTIKVKLNCCNFEKELVIEVK